MTRMSVTNYFNSCCCWPLMTLLMTAIDWLIVPVVLLLLLLLLCLEADDDDDDFYDAVDDDEKFNFKSSVFASEATSHRSVHWGHIDTVSWSLSSQSQCESTVALSTHTAVKTVLSCLARGVNSCVYVCRRTESGLSVDSTPSHVHDADSINYESSDTDYEKITPAGDECHSAVGNKVLLPCCSPHLGLGLVLEGSVSRPVLYLTIYICVIFNRKTTVIEIICVMTC